MAQAVPFRLRGMGLDVLDLREAPTDAAKAAARRTLAGRITGAQSDRKIWEQLGNIKAQIPGKTSHQEESKGKTGQQDRHSFGGLQNLHA